MLKWLGGCLILVVIVVAAAAWWTLRTMKASLGPDGSAQVTIGALPPRVFAALASGDSLSAWMAQGSAISTSRKDRLIPGDTIRIALRGSIGRTQEPLVWAVTEVIPDRLIVRRLITRKSERTMAVRRDSLAQTAADSTTVISTLVSPLLDSLQRDRGTLAGDAMLSMLRLQSKLELQSLKSHIEGAPAREPASTSPSPQRK